MSKPIINPFATTAQPNLEGDKNDWKIKTASNGLLFYFNTKTKKSQWDKPEVLKTPEERLNSTDWQEHTTGDGKVFYYNAKLKQSVWKMPPEVKAIKEKQAELRKQMSALDAQKAGGPKINVSITSNIASEQEVADYGPNYENLPHDQAVKIFMDVLRERTVPTMKWEQAQQLIKNDERSKVITSFSEQRKLFKEWVVQSKNQERQEYKQRVQRARENFRHMLEERNQLNSDAKYYKVFQLFLNDPRWKALDEREREQTFQDFLDDLYERERDERIQRTKHGREELRKMLAADQEITPATRWDEICEKYKDNSVWNDLHEYDRIQVFSKWIIELDRQEHDEKRKNRRLQERKNREAFRELLKEHIENRTLTQKTKWRHFVHAIKEDKRFYEMLGQNGSTPRELFEDQLEMLKDQHKRTKEDMKKIFKDTSVKVTPDMSFQQFEAALSNQEEFKVMDAKSKEYFFNYLLDKAKSREKESQKKQKKAMKRFTRFLKGLPDIKPDSDYKNFEKVISENEQFAILSQQEKETQFKTYIQDLKNQDEGQISDEGLDKTKKRKSKKKRSKRKKNYESSEGEHRDSSEERSESKSHSRSQSKEHRRKNKKEKRKGGKRSRSESEVDSDVEKKPEKKVQLDKEQGEQNKNKPEASMQEEKPEEKIQVAPVAQPIVAQPTVAQPTVAQPIVTVNEKVTVAEPSVPAENKVMQQETSKQQGPTGEKDDQDEREEGETRESGLVDRKSRSRSRSSRSASRERTKKKKKDRKHSKKGKKSEKKSKKKHRKRSYSPSESSDAD